MTEQLKSGDFDPDVLDMSLARAQQGNTQDYRRAFDLMVPPVRRYVYRSLAKFSQTHLTEDVVQETMIAIHLKLHTYDPAQPAMPWVYTIARYKTIDMLRRLKMKNISLDEPVYQETIGGGDEAQATEIRTDLNKLLSTLQPPQGDIIRALKVEGASVAELAKKYGFTESKVKVMVHRGLQKLNALVTAGEVSS